MHSLIVLLLLLPGPCAMLAIASQGIDSKALSSGVQSSLLPHRVALGASRHVCCELVVAGVSGLPGPTAAICCSFDSSPGLLQGCGNYAEHHSAVLIILAPLCKHQFAMYQRLSWIILAPRQPANVLALSSALMYMSLHHIVILISSSHSIIVHIFCTLHVYFSYIVHTSITYTTPHYLLLVAVMFAKCPLTLDKL